MRQHGSVLVFSMFLIVIEGKTPCVVGGAMCLFVCLYCVCLFVYTVSVCVSGDAI